MSKTDNFKEETSPYIKRYLEHGVIDNPQQFADMYSLANEVFQLHFPNVVLDEEQRFAIAVMLCEGALFHNTTVALCMINKGFPKEDVIDLTKIKQSWYDEMFKMYKEECALKCKLN